MASFWVAELVLPLGNVARRAAVLPPVRAFAVTATPFSERNCLAVVDRQCTDRGSCVGLNMQVGRRSYSHQLQVLVMSVDAGLVWLLVGGDRQMLRVTKD